MQQVHAFDITLHYKYALQTFLQQVQFTKKKEYSSQRRKSTVH